MRVYIRVQRQLHMRSTRLIGHSSVWEVIRNGLYIWRIHDESLRVTVYTINGTEYLSDATRRRKDTSELSFDKISRNSLELCDYERSGDYWVLKISGINRPTYFIGKKIFPRHFCWLCMNKHCYYEMFLKDDHLSGGEGRRGVWFRHSKSEMELEKNDLITVEKSKKVYGKEKIFKEK